MTEGRVLTGPMSERMAPPPYGDGTGALPHGLRSERSGRYAGERVEWCIPAGHDIYDPGQGAGIVTVPYDGGFVWIDDGHIVPMEFVRPASNVSAPARLQSRTSHDTP